MLEVNQVIVEQVEQPIYEQDEGVKDEKKYVIIAITRRKKMKNERGSRDRVHWTIT